MKKKILSILLCLSMVIGMTVGCGTSNGGSTGSTGTGVAAEAPPDTGVSSEEAAKESSGYKMGYNYFGSGGYSLAALANNTQVVADAAGDESLAMDDQFSVEQIVTDVENMINSNCNGVNIWLPADALYPVVANMCSEAGVYFTLNDKIPSDKDVIEAVKSNPYFAGACAPANAVYGEQLADYAIKQGWKTCIITSSTVGDPTDSPRLEAFKKVFEEAGGIIVDELHADTTADSLIQIQDSLTANGEVDVIYGVGSDYAINACTALEDHASWNTKVITSGLDKEALGLLNNESSPMTVITGDYWVAGFFSAIMLQNAIEGNVLKDADGNVIWVDDIEPYEVSAEKYPLYEKYIMNANLYTDEEIKAMIGITYDEMISIIDDYNLDNRLMAKYEAGIISAEEMREAGYDIE